MEIDLSSNCSLENLSHADSIVEKGVADVGGFLEQICKR